MRILTRFTGVRVLAVTLLAAVIPGVAAAQPATNVIDITNAQQLFGIGRTQGEPLNGTYELMNNVNLSVYGQRYTEGSWIGWYPIGLSSNPLHGPILWQRPHHLRTVHQG